MTRVQRSHSAPGSILALLVKDRAAVRCAGFGCAPLVTPGRIGGVVGDAKIARLI